MDQNSTPSPRNAATAWSVGAALVAVAIVAAIWTGFNSGKDTALRGLPRASQLEALPEGLASALVAAEGALASADPSQGLADIGNLYHANGYESEAEAYYARAQERGFSPAAKLLYWRGDVAEKRGDREAMRQRLLEAVSLNPSYWVARLRLGRAFAEQSRQAEALAQLEAILAQEPQNPQALYLLASLLRSQGKPSQAESALQRLLLAHPEHSGGNLLMAQLLAAANQEEQARAYRARIGNGRDAPPPDPWMEEILMADFDGQRLSFVFEDRIKGGDLEGAFRLLDRIEAVDAEGWRAPYLKATAFSQMRRYPLAAEWYGKTIEKGHGTVGVYEDYVRCLVHSGAFREALVAGEQAIERQRLSPSLYHSLARASLELGSTVAAIDYLKEGLAMDAADAGSNRLLGEQYLKLGYEDRAKPHLERAIASDRNDFASRATLGQMALESGELERAARLLGEALDLDDSQKALRPLLATARLRLGNRLAAAGDWSEARTRYEAAIAVDPSMEEAYFNLVKLALSRERFDVAEQTLHRLLERDPENAVLYVSLGDAQRAAGSLGEAASSWRKALRKASVGGQDGAVAQAARERLEALEGK